MQARLVARSQLFGDLIRLGVRRGSAVMVHTRMSAIGWVVGGAPTVIEAVMDTVGPEGTMLVLTGWEDRPPYHQIEWNPQQRGVYERECPVFDPLRSRAEVEHGRVAEAVRTWPGARHSRHPVCAFAAIGARAEWLVEAQSLDEGYGTNSPLDRLAQLDGDVVMLGAPLETVTLIHHAEYRASAASKRWVEYCMPVLIDGERRWRTIRELDSSNGALPYEELGLGRDAFEVIAESALAEGIGRRRRVGTADSYLFHASELIDYAVDWLNHRFDGGPPATTD